MTARCPAAERGNTYLFITFKGYIDFVVLKTSLKQQFERSVFSMANSSDSSSAEQSLDRESESDEVVSEEEDEVSKETQNASSFATDSYGKQQKDIQQGATTTLPSNGETLGQGPQLELAGHSIACAPNPYCDPYYGGMMTAYGQPMVHPQFLELHQARMPLPLEMAQEPVYVNAKQYNAILRRRQSRAKAELEKKLIKDRKPYLHESRHQHAMRRVRGSGGRFVKKTEVNSGKGADEDKNTTASSQSVNQTGVKRVRSESAVSLDPRKETPRGSLVNSLNTRTYLDEGRYDNGDNYQGSGYRLQSSDRGDGGSLGQQWITMSSSQASQRAVAMK
ncbi:nuclear transcription factor Y subunit A-9-like protein [Tanacetum coccineum]